MSCLAALGLLALGCGSNETPMASSSLSASSLGTDASADSQDPTTTGDSSDASATGTDGGTSTETSAETETSTETGEPLPDLPPPLDFGCDLFLQDCPEGQKCVPYASGDDENWNGRKCVPVLGQQAVGEACIYAGSLDATDDCDADSMCWATEDIDGELVGSCYAFCNGIVESPVCGNDMGCMTSPNEAISLCIGRCHPLLQDCVPGFSCNWILQDFGCSPAIDNLKPGEPCNGPFECAPGSDCVIDYIVPNCEGQGACCSIYCDLNLGDQPCEGVLPGTVCMSAYLPEEGPPPPGWENVGMCRLPP